MDMAFDTMIRNKIHLTCINTTQAPREQ